MDLTEKNKGAYKLQHFGPIYCINLDGQPERWHYMEDQYKYWQLTDYERISAYDGREDDLSDIIKGKYPKIYYEPKKIYGFHNIILVDLSSISITYDSKQILQLYNIIKKTHRDLVFLGVEFTNKIKDATIIEPDVTSIVEIESIFTYVDLMYSSFGVVSLHSGQNHLASAIKNQYNNELKVYCLMDDVEYVRQKKKGIFVFDNVTYLRY